MNWLARLIGLNVPSRTISVPEMDKRLMLAAQNDQIACDVLNESRRKRGQAMLRCGEGLPSWEGQLTTPFSDPSWEDL